jgi:hypothetical protein
MSIEALEEERDRLRRELIATQEMLYQVLYTVGEPVVVGEEQIKAGVEAGVQIAIDHNTEEGAFVFYLAKEEEDSDKDAPGVS